MAKSASSSSEDFEFIETPRVAISHKPVENFGVRTTSVSAGPQ